MKKLFYSLFALSSLTISAQEKTFTFDQKVSYDIKIPEEYQLFIDPTGLNLNFYVGKDALLGNSDDPTGYTRFETDGFFTTAHKFYDVEINSLENLLRIKAPAYYGEEETYQPYTDYFFGKINRLTRLNTSETFNGYTCSHFEIDLVENDDVKKNFICIDEKNPINNAQFLIPNQQINGLIVKYTDQDSSGMYIRSTSKSAVKVLFDEKKSIQNYQDKLNKLKADYAEGIVMDTASVNVDEAYADYQFDDPIFSYSNYATSEHENVNKIFNILASFAYAIVQNDDNYDGEKDFERSKALKTSEESTKQAIKQFKNNGLVNKSEAKELNNLFKTFYKDAKEFKPVQHVDANYAAEDVSFAEDFIINPEDFETYVSAYKNLDLDMVSLAIDDPSLKNYLSNAPDYCQNITQNLPNFSDKHLKNLVYNYAGQVCDLYIYTSGHVDLPSTIDAVRKSVLEINSTYESLSDDDKKKLKTYLDSLD